MTPPRYRFQPLPTGAITPIISGSITAIRDNFKQEWAEIRRRHHDEVPAMAWDLLDPLYAEVARRHQKILELERRIKAFVRTDEQASRLMQVSCIGALFASAIVCTVGNGRIFRNGRQFAAWLGLAP